MDKKISKKRSASTTSDQENHGNSTSTNTGGTFFGTQLRPRPVSHTPARRPGHQQTQPQETVDPQAVIMFAILQELQSLNQELHTQNVIALTKMKEAAEKEKAEKEAAERAKAQDAEHFKSIQHTLYM